MSTRDKRTFWSLQFPVRGNRVELCLYQSLGKNNSVRSEKFFWAGHIGVRMVTFTVIFKKKKKNPAKVVICTGSENANDFTIEQIPDCFLRYPNHQPSIPHFYPDPNTQRTPLWLFKLSEFTEGCCHSYRSICFGYIILATEQHLAFSIFF